MNTIAVPATEFKAKCLQLLDEVAATGAVLTITKHGHAVAQLVPMPVRGELFGALRGSVVAQQDLIAPVGGGWEADA
jgi:prevent-host-death family protein